MRVIARGGQGDVFLARDLKSGDYAAVKRLPKDSYCKEGALTSSAEAAQSRDGSEVSILKDLRHPGIPAFRSAFQVGQVHYLAMDYIEGETLKEILEQRRFSEEEVKIIARNLLAILSYLHRQDPPVIYLDLKPSNIILDHKNRVHLVDFGIARRKTGERIKAVFSALTRGYAAPEQYLLPARFDERTDLYALGVTLHYLLTGKNPNDPPYEFAPVRSFRRDVSTDLSFLIETLLQPNPKDRFQSAEDVRKALSEGLPKKRRIVKKQKILILGGVLLSILILFCLTGRENGEKLTAEGQTVETETERSRQKREKLSISPEGDVYEDYLLAEVHFDPKQGKVYYTTDGSEPDKDSAVYQDGIVVSEPVTKIRILQAGYDGREQRFEKTYHINKKTEEIRLDPSRPGVWELYYQLKKEWGEPVYNYELAKIRHLSRETYQGFSEELRNYLVFYKEEGEDGAYDHSEEGGQD